jgi:hypothetical protein
LTDVFPAAVRGLTWNISKAPEFSTIVQRGTSAAETRILQWQNPVWHWELIYNYVYDDPANIAVGLSFTDLKTLLGFLMKMQGQFSDFLYSDPSDNTVAPADQQMQLVSDSSNPIASADVGSSGGTGFTVGDQLGVTGGGGSGGVLQVATVSGGVILTFTILNAGTGYTTTTDASLIVLTGSGTGAPTANITAGTVFYTPIQRQMGGQFYEDITDLDGPLQLYANGTATSDYTLVGPGLAIDGNAYAGLVAKWNNQPDTPITGAFSFFFRVRFEMDQATFEEFMNQLWTLGGSQSSKSDVIKLVTARVPMV